MKKADWFYVYKFMNEYGKKVVMAILKNIKSAKGTPSAPHTGLIDTMKLYKSIGYRINNSGKNFQIRFTINGKTFGDFTKSKPARVQEYGVYVNYTKKGKKYFFPTGPGLGDADFKRGVKAAAKKDTKIFLSKGLTEDIKKIFKK